MLPFYFTINKRRWKFIREPLSDYRKDGIVHERHGLCDPPETKDKAVRVHSRRTGLLELWSIIHEVRHAENWDMYDEDYVDAVSGALAKLLWRLGYRKLTPEELSERSD